MVLLLMLSINVYLAKRVLRCATSLVQSNWLHLSVLHTESVSMENRTRTAYARQMFGISKYFFLFLFLLAHLKNVNGFEWMAKCLSTGRYRQVCKIGWNMNLIILMRESMENYTLQTAMFALSRQVVKHYDNKEKEEHTNAVSPRMHIISMKSVPVYYFPFLVCHLDVLQSTREPKCQVLWSNIWPTVAGGARVLLNSWIQFHWMKWARKKPEIIIHEEDNQLDWNHTTLRWTTHTYAFNETAYMLSPSQWCEEDEAKAKSSHFHTYWSLAFSISVDMLFSLLCDRLLYMVSSRMTTVHSFRYVRFELPYLLWKIGLKDEWKSFYLALVAVNSTPNTKYIKHFFSSLLDYNQSLIPSLFYVLFSSSSDSISCLFR